MARRQSLLHFWCHGCECHGKVTLGRGTYYKNTTLYRKYLSFAPTKSVPYNKLYLTSCNRLNFYTNHLTVAGPLIKDMISNMMAVSGKTSTRKLSLYAAHDITIVNVRRALGFDDVTFKPKLGAALILELHLIDNQPQVQVKSLLE